MQNITAKGIKHMGHKLKKAVKLCLIIIAIPMLAFAFTWVFPINSPAPYRIINEKGKPLTLDETWEEKDLFQVKINQMIKLPIDDPSINLDQHKIQLLKQKNIHYAAIILFEFKNIGFEYEYKGRAAGLVFNVSAYGYQKNTRIGNVPLDHLGDGIFYPANMENDGVYKDMEAKENYYTVLIEDETESIIYTFRTAIAGTLDQYEKDFECKVP